MSEEKGERPPLPSQRSPSSAEPAAPVRNRLLVVGDCISKDVIAKLRRAGYSIVRADDIAAALSSAAAIQFDFAIIDVDGMPKAEAEQVQQAFLQKKVQAVAVLRCPDGIEAAPAKFGARVPKPVAFEGLVDAFRSQAADGTEP